MRVECPELTRCCFCLPLRKGLLVFGYLKLIFSLIAVGLYSYAAHVSSRGAILLYQGSTSYFVATEVCIVIYIIETVVTGLLIYGLHKQVQRYVKWFFYYGVTTTAASVVIQILETSTAKYLYLEIEILSVLVCGLFIEIYLLILIRSFLKKLEKSVEPGFENQLHQVVVNREKERNGAEPFSVTM